MALGTGTRIIAALGGVVADDAPADDNHLEREKSPLARRVLIVDDEAGLRELVKCQLEKAGFQTREAATGIEALEAARGWKPDAVVLDLMLSDIPGTDVCRVLRSDPKSARVPRSRLDGRVTH